jgi:hypothetical protein
MSDLLNEYIDMIHEPTIIGDFEMDELVISDTTTLSIHNSFMGKRLVARRIIMFSRYDNESTWRFIEMEVGISEDDDIYAIYNEKIEERLDEWERSKIKDMEHQKWRVNREPM